MVSIVSVPSANVYSVAGRLDGTSISHSGSGLERKEPTHVVVNRADYKTTG